VAKARQGERPSLSPKGSAMLLTYDRSLGREGSSDLDLARHAGRQRIVSENFLATRAQKKSVQFEQEGKQPNSKRNQLQKGSFGKSTRNVQELNPFLRIDSLASTESYQRLQSLTKMQMTNKHILTFN